MNDDQYFLANAYFDGELTDEEVQIAEGDPDVMSEVDRLGSLQSLLRASDPPSASVRSAALAAAMAEFASVTASVAATNHAGRPPTRSNIAPVSRHRPAYSRYLAVAAAVAAIGAVGVVVAGVIGSGSDDDSAETDLAVSSSETLANNDLDRSASATTLAMSLEMEAAPEQVLAESAPAAGTFVGMADEESAATTAASDVAAGTAGTEMSDATDMTMVAPADSTPYPPPGGPIEPIADRDQTITTPGQLAGLGVLLSDLRDAGTLGATPETSCLFDDAAVEIVDTTRYRFPDITTTVLVALVVGDIEGHTLAIDPDTCEVLVVGP